MLPRCRGKACAAFVAGGKTGWSIIPRGAIYPLDGPPFIVLLALRRLLRFLPETVIKIYVAMKNTFLHYACRYLVFLCGIACMTLGIVLTTKAELGTTPISSIPYVASLATPFTLGEWTIAFCILLVGLQVALLRGKLPKVQYLQIPVSFFFGLCIDFWMWLFSWITPMSYPGQLLLLAMGIFTVSVGIFVMVSANVVVMSGEGLVMVLSLILRRNFGTLKSIVDCTMVSLAILLSLLCFHELRGVREGTILSAIFVGMVVKLFFFLWNKGKARVLARREARIQATV